MADKSLSFNKKAKTVYAMNQSKEFFIPLDGADSAFCLRRDADDPLSGHSAGQNVETG